MKRYRLKKDLPTFNAGDTFVLESDGLWLENVKGDSGHWRKRVCAYAQTTLEKFPNTLKDWFEEIPEEPKTVWDLKEGDECWYIDALNLVDEKNWENSFFDRQNRGVGNVFLTKENVEKELARRRARVILERDTKGFKPDWSNSEQSKWEVSYNYMTDELKTSNQCVWNFGTIVFATQADAEESIKKHEKEWLCYLNVEDGYDKS